ncbi:hypothetical protein SAMN02745136_05466 [Anaerocolumna jejuensis DSM 15929]|uniref:Uncharacterized protein n=1 Tax=Anaerocolumna jejuensis DSM 15929 TaxID=1121322 RepID=A0A1M7CMF8_9FIRM|nr:hypothetical protein [Anaerocolumna jejuensis]SHL68468.1 hypothetical protein SAMN02745136_05466 [Anaerocolumna jejuensis DSM 15929]
MRNNEYWEIFARSGNIHDYLSYIACTVERGMEVRNGSKKEGGSHNDSNGCDGNGSFSHARG